MKDVLDVLDFSEPRTWKGAKMKVTCCLTSSWLYSLMPSGHLFGHLEQ